MTTTELLELIQSLRGKFWGCTFTKRGDGSTRRMCCRTGVKKHLKGGPHWYDFSAKGLLCVWDSVKKEYRCVPLDAVSEIRVRGKCIKVTN